MPEAPDLHSAFEAAEHAASAGDYASAERHLSAALSQQEAMLGPLHPDLANTLNNLGVVYDTIDRPDDAERCYRRAYSIATTSLAPGHPFIATSEKNLRDFCNARGKAFEPRAPLPEITLTSAPLTTQLEPRHERPAHRPSRWGGAGMLAVAVAAVLALLGWRFWFGGGVSVESERAAAPPPSDVAAPAPEPEPREPVVERVPAAPPPAVKTERPYAAPATQAPVPPARAERPAPTSAAAPTRRPAVEPAGAAPALVEANVCRSVREWRCDLPGRPVESGQLFFYTRVKSPGSTTVEHWWYRGDRLHRRVTLRIQENQRSGFRTYSRTNVNAGNWRVELRARDGAVLHTETFTVR